jgi:antirestriction protein ArdC
MGNKFLAYAQARTLNIRGFQQWKEVHRQVKKGEHSIYIWAPRMVKDEKEEEKTKLIGFRPIAVFPIETTDGEPLKEEMTPHQLPPLFEVADRLGVTVKFQPVIPDRLGDCGHNLINLGTDDPRVFWHELAHAAHQAIDAEYSNRSATYKETVAEFTACVLAALYGHDYTGTTWAYLKMFSSDPLKSIMIAGRHVEKVLNLVLSEEVAK